MGLVLGSRSPRRLELLASVGIIPDAVCAADIDESPLKKEPVRAYVLRVASQKAAVVAKAHPQDYVLASDTVVESGGRLFFQPKDRDEAKVHLTHLSGRRHRVLTAVVVISPEGKVASRIVTTRLSFKVLSLQEIEEYLNLGEWEGVAGSYRIQGAAAAFVKSMNGSYHAVVGLPLYETVSLLKGLGYTKKA